MWPSSCASPPPTTVVLVGEQASRIVLGFPFDHRGCWNLHQSVLSDVRSGLIPTVLPEEGLSSASITDSLLVAVDEMEIFLLSSGHSEEDLVSTDVSSSP